MLRHLIAAVFSVLLLGPALGQDEGSGADPAVQSRSTLESIMARQAAQRGEVVDQPRTRDTVDRNSAAFIAGEIAAGATDSDVFRAIRYGTDDVVVSTNAPAAGVLIQTGGMRWLEIRQGPLLFWGGVLLLATLAILALFYLLRGPIRIEGGRSGRTILRFSFIERFTHWLLAGSFILLALTGLWLLFGRQYIIPVLGHELYAEGATASKWVHNNVSWAFMLALVLAVVFWIWHNIPDRTDWVWLKQGGGLFSKRLHPPARKFNAGQKIIFWIVVILGVSVSASGLALLFPYELPMFAKTFGILNATGIPDLLGSPLPTELAPQEEQQFAQLWHSIIGFVMMAVVLAHIYLGTLGMEGAFDAMGSGRVDTNWAEAHHSLWVAEKEAEAARREAPAQGSVAPAE